MLVVVVLTVFNCGFCTAAEGTRTAIRSLLLSTKGESGRHMASADGGSPPVSCVAVHFTPGILSALASSSSGQTGSLRTTMPSYHHPEWQHQLLPHQYLQPPVVETAMRGAQMSGETRHKKFGAARGGSSPHTGDHASAGGLVPAVGHSYYGAAGGDSGVVVDGKTVEQQMQGIHRIVDEPSRSRSYSTGALSTSNVVTSPDLSWQVKMAMEQVSGFTVCFELGYYSTRAGKTVGFFRNYI